MTCLRGIAGNLALLVSSCVGASPKLSLGPLAKRTFARGQVVSKLARFGAWAGRNALNHWLPITIPRGNDASHSAVWLPQTLFKQARQSACESTNRNVYFRFADTAGRYVSPDKNLWGSLP